MQFHRSQIQMRDLASLECTRAAGALVFKLQRLEAGRHLLRRNQLVYVRVCVCVYVRDCTSSPTVDHFISVDNERMKPSATSGTTVAAEVQVEIKVGQRTWFPDNTKDPDVASTVSSCIARRSLMLLRHLRLTVRV